MGRSWTGQGTSFEVEWAGRPWTLRVDGERPGLVPADGATGPLLALEGLAAVGRWEPEALSGASLRGVECRFGRVEATYAPAGWGDLTVRAAWAPFEDLGLDLEVQAGARSVDELRGVEVRLLSQVGRLPGPGSARSVEPRDARSAALTYDGREADLANLTTMPPGSGLPPWMVPRAGLPGRTYIELAHPHDVSRRIFEGRLPYAATRYGLFGYDLERGVVLRGRLRALWASKEDAFGVAERHYDAFLREPPPLGS